MILHAGDAKVTYDKENQDVKFEGSMRLANMKEYDQVTEFLKENTNGLAGKLTLDFTELQFLNSSGITTLSLFILNCKKKGDVELLVKGSKDVAWQQKSLANFKKLWSDIHLEI